MTAGLFDLEPLSKERLASSNGVSYAQFRKALRPNYRRVWVEISLGWLCIVLLAVCSVLVSRESRVGTVLYALGGGAALGFMIAYLHLFFHEAVHYQLAASRTRSDRLANIFLGPVLLTCVEFYRYFHMAHHRLLGTRHDTENSYFQPLTPQFLIYSLSGLRVAQVLFSREKPQAVVIPDAVRNKHKRYFLFGAMVHANIVWAAAGMGSWALAGAWASGVFCFTPFFGAVRSVLEHRRDGAAHTEFGEQDPGKHTRVFVAGPFGLLFGAAGFNRHLLHHWDPGVSYTCLEEVEAFVLQTPLKDSYVQSRKTYFAVFKELYGSANKRRALLELRRHAS
jgi:fatty acid desaturase